MTTVVFLGPTLSSEEASDLLPATYRPPAALGDVYRAAARGATVVVVIDGVFERVPAVWHKEIHWVITRGVTVVGAASMGALRAAELECCGMIGVGQVFEAFRSGALTDDDEVAVRHAPVDEHRLGHSEAMVNIRFTLDDARRDGVVSPMVADTLARLAKATFYADRSYAALIAGARTAGVGEEELGRFSRWLTSGARDVKREDAVAALRMVRDGTLPPPQAELPFEHTQFWEIARLEIEASMAMEESPGPGRTFDDGSSNA